MNKYLNGKKVYVWCILVILVSAILAILVPNLMPFWAAYITIAIFGGIAFARHTVSKIEKDLKVAKGVDHPHNKYIK